MLEIVHLDLISNQVKEAKVTSRKSPLTKASVPTSKCFSTTIVKPLCMKIMVTRRVMFQTTTMFPTVVLTTFSRKI